mmetsp:Transcript_42731/g.110492  ORF Transcript_42731/g.110492 Transcript_42731/m.110492 type:complete len:367 (-) Transcript_42731:99-1199(-)
MDEELLKLPPHATCPISQRVMKDPVICADGHSYERTCIEHWLRMGNFTSPSTNMPLLHCGLTANISLRNIIQVLVQRSPAMEKEQERIRQWEAALEATVDRLVDERDHARRECERLFDLLLEERSRRCSWSKCHECQNGPDHEVPQVDSLPSEDHGLEKVVKISPSMLKAATVKDRWSDVESEGIDRYAALVPPSMQTQTFLSQLSATRLASASRQNSSLSDGLPRPPLRLSAAELVRIKARRREEAAFVRERDKDATRVWYLVEVDWLLGWSKFVAQGGPEPKAINNAALLDDATGEPKDGLQAVKDYRGVNEAVWAFLHGRYGGGPALRREKVNIYLPAVEEPVAPAKEASGRQRWTSYVWPLK